MRGIATSPLHSRGCPTGGTKIRRSCPTPTFSGAHKWAELLRHPAFSRVPNKGDKIRICYFIPSHSPGTQRGRCGYVTPLLSGVPISGDKIGSGYLTPAFTGAYKGGGGDCYITPASSVVPNKGEKSELATSPPPSQRATSGRNCYVTTAFSGFTNKGDKFRIGCLTRVFLGGHKWAQLLCHTCFLGGPQQTGQKQSWCPHLCVLGGATGGRNCYGVPARGSPTRGTNSELVASPVTYGGPTSGRNCYVTPALSGCPCEQDKIKVGRPCLSGAMRQRILGSHTPPCNRCMVITTCLSGGGEGQGGRIAMTQLHCRGSPRQGRNSKLAASPVPS